MINTAINDEDGNIDTQRALSTGSNFNQEDKNSDEALTDRNLDPERSLHEARFDLSNQKNHSGHFSAGQKDGQSSDANSSKFFEKSADTMAEGARAVKQYASEVSDKISQNYSALQTRLKAYIGGIEDTQDYLQDNKYIIKGYRINHSTCRSLCKSLCTCHNEFVNVWSHIGGVIVFLTLLVTVCVDVIPNQFWYANQLDKDFESNQSKEFKGANLADPVIFIDLKIDSLEEYQKDLTATGLSSKDAASDFEDEVTEVMYRIEGISHFTIEHFYTFDYLSDYTQLFNPTLDEILEHWYTTFTGYNAQLEEQLALSQSKINIAQNDSKYVDLDQYVQTRYNFLSERLDQLDIQLKNLHDAMQKELISKTETPAQLADKTGYLNQLQEQIAPDFLDANQILNEVPIWPLIINIFAACFCMGCSATYHLMSAKNEKYQSNLARLDYGGISILIFGTAFPTLYYGMACQQVLLAKQIYMTVLGLACVACFTVTLIPKFDQPQWQKFRGIMYIILGLSTASMFVMFSFMDPYITPLSGWIYALGGYIYIQGAIIYMIRCPERCAPGKFDFCGASHQIFHFAVLIAALMHYIENYTVFRHRQVMECPIWEH